MINREIIYERSVSKSYIKIPACIEPSFDEAIMLKKQIPGFLQVEKCYINGMGQYWYNITGKQALDSYARMKEIGISFIEKLLLHICFQIERLEWNLLGSHCLVLDPEFIFVGTGCEEISFLLYPENKGEVCTELRKLVEYLLTRLNHKDTKAVETLYAIYEITLSEGYSLGDIRDIIEKNKEVENKEERPEDGKIERKEEQNTSLSENITSKVNEVNIFQKIQGLWERIMRVLKTEEPIMVYPEKEETPLQEKRENSYRISSLTVSNPTVCLVSSAGSAKGILMHQGMGAYPDYELSERKCQIGNNPTADLYIQKDTVSNTHAYIEYIEGQYYIEDLNSTNGTYVNETPVNYKQKVKLNSGDEIRFANVRYQFL